ncbi:18234_t:CDS:10, partial [Acaulospora morrowiae]
MTTYFDFSEIVKENENCKLRAYATTAVRSCTISHMLTCSLRGSERKDIVFAKETALELLEIVDEGKLNSIIEQPIFGTIKDIKVLHSIFPEPVLYDPFEKKEGTDSENNLDLRVIPGQDVLVCLSDSGMLLFLAYTESISSYMNNGKAIAVQDDDSSDFDIARMTGKFQLIKEIQIAKPGFDFKDLGRVVCVDPMGRLIAVAAWYNTFQIFSIPSGSIFNYDPSNNTKLYSQEGVIWNMTFLYPSDESRALLAMVVVDDRKTPHIVIYNFLATEKLEDDMIPTSIPRDAFVPLFCFLPMHLIPLPNFPECFLLVNEKEICFIHARHGKVKSGDLYPRPLPDPQSLMTAFAYPMDTSVLKRAAALPHSPKQYVYAGMENGGLYRIDIMSEKSIEFTLVRNDGINPVGSTMTSLCLDPEIGDIIIIGGDMCDGAVVKANPKSRAEITYEIPNWAPIWDFQMLDLNKEGHNVIFSCSGRGRQGSIRVIRKSFGVNILSSSDAEFDGVVSLWNLKCDVNDGVDTFLALSFINSTRLMQMTENGLNDVSDRSGFNLKVHSILVASYEPVPGYLIQIHKESIIISKPNIDVLHPITENVERYEWQVPENMRIEVAAVCQSMVFIGLTSGKENVICVLKLYYDAKINIMTFSDIAHVDLDCSPSFIRCFSVSSLTPVPLCIIGTYKTSVKFLSLSSENFLTILHEEILDLKDKTIIPESVYLIGNEEKAYFLVGIREGTIVYYEWSWSSENKLMLSQPNFRRIGASPVKLIVSHPNLPLLVDEENKSVSVLALSDRPWKIEYSHNTGFKFVCVKFKHYEHVQEATVFDYANLPRIYFFIAKDCLNFVQLDNFTNDNLRTIPVYDTPRRLIYDDFSKLLLVACTSHTKPFPSSVLKLVDPVTGKINDTFDLQPKDYPDTRESVYSIAEWKFTSERQEYRWFFIGTGHHMANKHAIGQTPPIGGRFLTFTISKIQDENEASGFVYKLTNRIVIDVEGIVHAICPLSDKYLLVSAENTMNLLRFDLEKKKFYKVHVQKLQWQILSINVHGTHILVGTSQCSIMYEFVAEKERFRLLKSERSVRLNLESILLSENFSIGSDKRGNVFGLWYNEASSPIDSCLVPVFSFNEAEAVSRFRSNFHKTQVKPDAEVSSSETKTEPKETSADIIWDARHDLDDHAAIVMGCSLLGSAFMFTRISIKDHNLLLNLQLVLENWPTTRPCLGNNNGRFRKMFHENSINHVIDGEMVSQFLKLSRSEQCRIVDMHPELIMAGTLFLRGDQFKLEEELYNKQHEDILETIFDLDEDHPMTPIHIDQNDVDEMNIDFESSMDQDFPDENFETDETENKDVDISRSMIQMASAEEIVDAL